MSLEMIGPPLLGGALIGLASLMVLFFYGKIAGISGILGGTLVLRKNEWPWQASFLLGLFVGGALMLWQHPSYFPTTFRHPSMWAYVAAGLLVGFGTRLGSGCTSGHGVCGIGRFSARSIVATITFITSGVVTVWFVNSFWGGAV